MAASTRIVSPGKGNPILSSPTMSATTQQPCALTSCCSSASKAELTKHSGLTWLAFDPRRPQVRHGPRKTQGIHSPCRRGSCALQAGLRNIDDVNGPVTVAGNEQFVTAECHAHRLTANLDRCLLPE